MAMDKWVSAEINTHVVPGTIAGVPTYYDADKEFGAKHFGLMSDGQFVAANLKAEDGREFGIMLHMMCVNPIQAPDSWPGMLSIISMTDFTANTYCVKEDVFMGDQMSYATEDMDLKTPISYMRREGKKFYAGTDLPDGKGRIELDMTQVTPFLYNCATGQFPFLNDEVLCYQYSVPGLKCTGKLTLDGKEYAVEGDAWIDRQWGDGNIDFVNRTFKWYWMNLNLEDGTKIRCWDVCPNGKKENAWATVLLPTGAHIVTAMEPWSKDEGDYYVGATGQQYPTSYVLRMPGIDSEFHVKLRGLPEQEIVSNTGEDKYEAAMTFTGTFMGKSTKGFNYVELVGSFK